ncbi:MAG TPA: PorT family protein, partial [Flavobacteriaceae bacterium]|nr:PorT family protein [Flavobacteriaceae bacterium]
MKKLILSTVVLLSGLTFMSAQSDSKMVQLGVKGG